MIGASAAIANTRIAREYTNMAAPTHGIRVFVARASAFVVSAAASAMAAPPR